MYDICDCVDHAIQVFDKLLDTNFYTYTTILNVLLDKKLLEKALSHFERIMLEDGELEFFIFPVALKICVELGRVELGG